MIARSFKTIPRNSDGTDASLRAVKAQAADARYCLNSPDNKSSKEIYGYGGKQIPEFAAGNGLH